MKAFILAAGDGTRLRPLTSNIPKPLLLTAGKPFLQHTIEALRAVGIKEMVILVGWMGKRIEEEFGDGKRLGVKISYLTQHQRLGTAHAIGLGRELFKDTFLCVNGDVLVSKGLAKDILAFAKKVRGHVMALSQVPNPTEYGVITLMGSMVTGIVEKPSKPKGNLVNAGIYVFKPDIFDHIAKTPVSPRGEYEITTTLTTIMKEGALFGMESQYKWIDVGRPWDLLEANEFLCKDLKTSIKGTVEKGVSMSGAVVIGKGALVKSGTYIEGPVVIGERAVVGPNSYLRANTCLGPDTKVGASSEVKNSIIMAHSHIPHLNYVGDSIICERCNLGAGTKIANLRLDEANIHVVLKGKYMDTGRRKLGAIIGDDVKTGINATIDVGTIIGEGSFIGPGCIAKGTLLPNSKIV